jgi:2-succinyl-6-hydroxy-2,4-cyclohexadiene-1-carboxylate synthase
MHILALHGFTGCGEDFATFSPLCRRVDTWHSPNLPGHGTDPQLNCSPEATIEFVHRHSKSSNILLGYSMGARAALLHAVQNPKKWDALILISPNPGIENQATRTERRIVDEKLAQRIEQDGVDAFIEFWQNTPMIRSQKNIRKDWRDAMQAHRKQHTAKGLAVSLRQFGQGQCPNLWPKLEKLTLPTLLLSGIEDRKYTDIAKLMSEALPDCTHHKIEGAGHMPHLETPSASADSINNFLDIITAKSGSGSGKPFPRVA